MCPRTDARNSYSHPVTRVKCMRELPQSLLPRSMGAVRRGSVINKAKEQLRSIYGDHCYWCGRRMLFFKQPNHQHSATLEHHLCKTKGWYFNNLRLCCKSCNI